MRLSKFVVEFKEGDIEYRASFFHTHVRMLPRKDISYARTLDGGRAKIERTWLEEDPKGIPNQTAKIKVIKPTGSFERIFPQRIRHITRCELTHAASDMVLAEGVAKCSMKDDYNWHVGINLAFKRAVAAEYPDMPRTQERMLIQFWLALRQKSPDYTRPSKKLAVHIPKNDGHVPPVAPPGRGRTKVLPRIPGVPMPIGFVPVIRNGVTMVLPPGRAQEILTPDQIIEAELLAAETRHEAPVEAIQDSMDHPGAHGADAIELARFEGEGGLVL